MELNNIASGSIKLAFFDFDETLAIHLNNPDGLTDGNAEFFAKAYIAPESFYEDIVPCGISELLFNIICYFRILGIKMFCLSGMHSSVHLNAKKAFIEKHYGKDIEFIMAAGQENKIVAIKELAHAYGCNFDQIIHFDDNADVITQVCQHGILGIHVDQVATMKIDNRFFKDLMDD